MLLQSSYRFFGKEVITKSAISEVGGVISPEIIDYFYQSCSNGNFETVNKTVGEIIKAGFTASQFINQV